LSHKKNIVIVGATSSIAEHCARRWIQKEAASLTLIGRDAGRIRRVVADLKTRSPQSDIYAITTEFLDPDAILATVNATVARGAPDIVLIAHGALPEQADCQDDLQACRVALDINGVSPALYAEAFARHMAQARHGVLALIGSVAGDRGRKSNYVYGAAKGLLGRYAQGLRHRLAGSGVKVVLVKPGPTETPMTAHLKGQGMKLAAVEEVAGQIVRAIEKGKAVAYVPGKWRFIMMVIRHLPDFIFHKMNI
jgi:short-subunit dehydrogenase